MTHWRYSLRPRAKRPEARNALAPLAIIGLVTIIALILILVVVVRGPDTHANLWNEAADYSRTQVAYTSPYFGPPPTTDLTPTPSGEVSFSGQALPIFQAKCVACHGLGFSAKEISLTSYEALMDTEAHEPLVIPGKPGESLLVDVLRREVSPMPPTGPLPEEHISLIEEWIKQGAKNN